MVALETSKVQLKTEINNRRISKITRNKINNLVIHIYIYAHVCIIYTCTTLIIQTMVGMTIYICFCYALENKNSDMNNFV